MFFERIHELRNSLGINQVEFGRRLHVTKQCVSNWENGNIQPSVDMLIQICTLFHVSADYLLGLSVNCSLDVTGLTAEQILHIQNIVNDIRNANPKEPTEVQEQKPT